MSRIPPRLAVVLLPAGAGAPARAIQQAPGAYSVPSFGSLRDIVITTVKPDARPPMVLQDVHGMTLGDAEAPREGAGPFAVLRDVSDLHVRDLTGVADGRRARIAAGTLPDQPQ